MKDAKLTLSLDLTNPRTLELFPLIFAYNHVSTEVSRAMREGNMVNLVSLQTPLNELRHELERRGVLAHFLKLKGLEVLEMRERAEHTEQTEHTKGDRDEHTLN